jgi:hypothetical protein
MYIPVYHCRIIYCHGTASLCIPQLSRNESGVDIGRFYTFKISYCRLPTGSETEEHYTKYFIRTCVKAISSGMLDTAEQVTESVK